jgi:hypothetical protein
MVRATKRQNMMMACQLVACFSWMPSRAGPAWTMAEAASRPRARPIRFRRRITCSFQASLIRSAVSSSYSPLAFRTYTAVSTQKKMNMKSSKATPMVTMEPA